MNSQSEKDPLSDLEKEELEELLLCINNLEGWRIESTQKLFGFYQATLFSVWKNTVDVDGVPLNICIVNSTLTLTVLWLTSQGIIQALNSKITVKKLNETYDLDIF